MSFKKVEEVKRDRAFKPLDLIIYSAVAVILVAVFLSVFLTKSDKPFSGIEVYSGGELKYTYAFDGGGNISGEGVEEEITDGIVSVRVTCVKGYNVIKIDVAARSVRVEEADCKGKDCVYTPAIVDSDGVIYCSPHGLKIIPLGRGDDGTIIVG